MSRPALPQSFSNVKTIEDLSRYSSIAFDELAKVINGNISFTDNIFSFLVTIAFSGTGDVVIPHGLRTVPTGFLVVNKTASVDVWAGSGANSTWTTSYIVLQASGAASVTIRIFA